MVSTRNMYLHSIRNNYFCCDMCRTIKEDGISNKCGLNMFRTSVLCILLAYAFSVNGFSLCLRYCGDQPIQITCATDGELIRIFRNECELKNAECSDHVSWTKTSLSECSKVSVQLIRNPLKFAISNIDPTDTEPIAVKPEPISGTPDGFNIVNMVKIAAKKSLVDPGCRFMCPMVYSPVCGYDGTTYKIFGNSCTLSNTNCMTRETGAMFAAVEPEKCSIGSFSI